VWCHWGEIESFLPRCLRTGWQSVISQEKIPWNTSPWLGIEPGPRGGQTVRFTHFPTELSWLSYVQCQLELATMLLRWGGAPLPHRLPSSKDIAKLSFPAGSQAYTFETWGGVFSFHCGSISVSLMLWALIIITMICIVVGSHCSFCWKSWVRHCFRVGFRQFPIICPNRLTLPQPIEYT